MSFPRISAVVLAAAVATGCSTVGNTIDSITPELPDWAGGSFVHKIDVQQGNVLEQANIDRLKPGMEKRQVRFVMGTPLLVDVFHQDRWDYVYTFQPGGKEMEEKRVTLEFENDRLVRITGDYRPADDAPEVVVKATEVVVVPLGTDEEVSLLDRFLGTVGVDIEDAPDPEVVAQ